MEKENSGGIGNGAVTSSGSTARLIITYLFILALPVVLYLIFVDFWKNKTIVITKIFDNTEFVRELSSLEVAERGTTEEIERSITESKLWDFVKSTAILKVRFRANYVYTVSSARDDWRFKYEDEIAYIEAPVLRVRTPVAIPTDNIQKSVDGGWLVFGEKGDADRLVEELTHIANSRGDSRHAINLVKDKARNSIEKFFYEWFLKEKLKVKNIRVKFPDESGFGLFDNEGRKL